MLSSDLITLAGVILGSGSLAALLTLWLRRKREPIERDGLALANAQESIKISGSVADSLHEEMQKLRERFDADIDALREEMSDLRCKLDAEHKQTRRQTRRVEAWQDWHDDLSGRWAFHRQAPTPPPPPRLPGDTDPNIPRVPPDDGQPGDVTKA